MCKDSASVRQSMKGDKSKYSELLNDGACETIESRLGGFTAFMIRYYFWSVNGYEI